MAGPIRAACGDDGNGSGGDAIRIGYVPFRTGAFASFGEADDLALSQVRQVFGGGLMIAGITYEVRIVARDSPSDSNRSAQVASELILDEEIDLMLVSSIPDTRTSLPTGAS